MSTQFDLHTSSHSSSFMRGAGWLGALCLLVCLAPGCAAFRPVRGVPAAYLPEQYYGPSRQNKHTIDLSLLERTPPDQYRVAGGDVLSIYIPRILGRLPSDPNADPGIEPPINMPYSPADPPTIGYPWTVRDDNTLALPQIPPINVFNMTLHEVEQAIVRAYTVEHHILQPDEALVMVALQRPRVHRVLVVRQEANAALTEGSGGTLNIGTTGRGTARVVTLKAYENDVMHALAMAEGADGLPGNNAKNMIYVIRRRPRPMAATCPPYPTSTPGYYQPAPLMTPPPQGGPQPYHAPVPTPAAATGHPQGQYSQAFQPVSYEATQAGGYVQPPAYGTAAGGHAFATPTSAVNYPPPPAPAALPMQPVPGHSFGSLPPIPEGSPNDAMLAGQMGWDGVLANLDPTINNPNVIKIPLRIGPGEMPHITEDQITLHDGDIVFIDNRETEVFYTGGLLGGGQYTLPRDYDLRVLEAVSIAEGRSQGGGGNVSRTLGGVSALNQDVGISASRLAILRTLPNGRRVNIEVDLHRAMRFQEENIIVQPGDVLILEYTCAEAVCATIERYLLEGALIGIATSVWSTGSGGGGR